MGAATAGATKKQNETGAALAASAKKNAIPSAKQKEAAAGAKSRRKRDQDVADEDEAESGEDENKDDEDEDAAGETAGDDADGEDGGGGAGAGRDFAFTEGKGDGTGGANTTIIVGKKSCDAINWRLLRFPKPPQVNEKRKTHCWAIPEWNRSRRQLRLYIKDGFCPQGFSEGFDEEEKDKPSLMITHPRFAEIFPPCDKVVKPTLEKLFTGVKGLSSARKPKTYGAMYTIKHRDDGSLYDGLINGTVKMQGSEIAIKDGIEALTIIDEKGIQVDPNSWRNMTKPFGCDAIVKLISARRLGDKFSLKWELTTLRIRPSGRSFGRDEFPDSGIEEDEDDGRGQTNADPAETQGGGGGGGGESDAEYGLHDDGGGVETEGGGGGDADPDDAAARDNDDQPIKKGNGNGTGGGGGARKAQAARSEEVEATEEEAANADLVAAAAAGTGDTEAETEGDEAAGAGGEPPQEEATGEPAQVADEEQVQVQDGDVAGEEAAAADE